jgi:hypothetical protein
MRLLIRLVSFLLLLNALTVSARVVRVEIASRQDVLNGKTFGEAGAYERITGRIFFSLPVANLHNQRIVDLNNAVNLKNGEVEFSANFMALRPKDAHKGNGSLLLENPNRGRSRIVALVDGGDWDAAKDAGDAWFLRSGFTVVSLGWQWDAYGDGALRLDAPVAKENGKTINGLLRGDFMLTKETQEVPLGHLIMGTIGGTEYPVAPPAADSLSSATSLHTPSMRPTPSLLQHGCMAKASRRMEDFCATSSTRASMLTKKEGWRSMAFSPTLPVRVAAVSITASRSPHAMDSPPRRFSFQRTSSLSPTSLRKILSWANQEVSSTAP